jgi:CheY-like chemotaxis protein
MGGEPRVLVVDDQRGHRLTTSLILRQAGYDVTLASSGEQAVELFRGEPFDAVIMDLRMPGMGGVAALEKIRSIRLTPVFVVTAYAIDEMVEQAQRAGATQVLRKPVDFDSLLAELERAL